MSMQFDAFLFAARVLKF